MKPSPTGFQVAFLILAVDFFVMLVARWMAARVGWPESSFNLLGNLIFFPFALIVLLSVGAARRFLLQQFERPLGMNAVIEAATVTLTKACVPFAIVGAAVAIHFHVSSGDPATTLGLATTRGGGDARYFSALGLVGAVIAISLGPVVEELLYRGLLYRLWERQFGWVASLLLTCLAFGAAHPGSFISTFLGSVFYVCLLRRTGTLWAPIAAHIGYNFLVAWPLLGHLLAIRPAGNTALLVTWWPYFACLAFVAIAVPAYVALAHRAPR